MCFAEEVEIHSGVVKIFPEHLHIQIIFHWHIHKLKSVALFMKEFLLLIFSKKTLCPPLRTKSLKYPNQLFEM
jgi:hypothetical protein